MKYFLILLLAGIAIVSLLSFNKDDQHNDQLVTGLPWQIEILPDGNTRVFDITLGQTTLGEAIKQLGDDMKLAIIAAPDQPGTLEAYYGHNSFGPITGKLILLLDVAPGELSDMRERAFQDRGTRRYALHPDDLPASYRAPVKVINFLPSFNLDEEIAISRFGTPGEIIEINARQKHLLYPDKGLDLILSTDGKEVLQYLSPGDFSAHRAQLQK